MSILSRFFVISVVAGTALGLSSCGSTSNNDQGASFTALGFYQTGDGDIGDSGTIVLINEDVPGSQGVFPLIVPIDKDPEEVGIQGGFIGLQNNLTSQFIRTVRVDCSYEVQGSDPSLQIPSDSFPVTTVLQPAPADGSAATADSGNRAFMQIEIVSPDVMQYLNVNQNYLPALPFRMTAICSAVGVSEAGDNLVTNPVLYTIQFADSPECCTGTGTTGAGGGFQNGTGTGGSIDSFGSPTDGTDSTTTTTVP